MGHSCRRHPMIPVSFPWFVAAYLAIFLAGVLLLWIVYELACKKEERRASRICLLCRICGSRYRNETAEELPVCPVCGRRNERNG